MSRLMAMFRKLVPARAETEQQVEPPVEVGERVQAARRLADMIVGERTDELPLVEASLGPVVDLDELDEAYGEIKASKRSRVWATSTIIRHDLSKVG